MSWVDVELAALRASTGAAQLAVNWLIQSSLLLMVGLAVGWLLRRRGSAVQSAVYRMTLLAVLLCPVATWMLSLSGVPGWSIAMPDGYRFERVDDGGIAVVQTVKSEYADPIATDVREPEALPAEPLVLMGDALPATSMVAPSVSGAVDTFAPPPADRPEIETASLPAALRTRTGPTDGT